MPEHYIRVACIDDLQPGRMKRIDLPGRRILLANVDGRFYATDDTCTHEEASLSSGSLRGEFVKCPLHGSRFSVCTGAPLEEPAQERLQTYPVRIEQRDILIGLNAEPRQP